MLSKRIDQLYYLGKLLNRYGIANAVFVSDKDPEYKKYCERQGRTVQEQEHYAFNETRVILGIDKLAQEGMDAPLFDTMLFLHPIRDIEQGIGRILREAENKKPPVGFYLIDKINSYHNTFYAKKAGAQRMFLDLGHNVTRELNLSEIKQQFQNGEI